MAIKQFAIPLDKSSDESGQISIAELAGAGTSADFQLTNVVAGTTVNELNLITKKNGIAKDHVFTVTIASDHARVTLSHTDLSTVYADANGGDRDYVEAKWNIGQVDKPDKSIQYEIQGGQTYNVHKWPPNHPGN
jgi:hypothetical protein